MRSFVAAVAAVSALAAESVWDASSVVASVRAAGAKWEAGVNDKFVNMTLSQIKALMGTKRGAEMRAAQARHTAAWSGTALPLEALPTNFSVRTQWPACANVTGHIRDQSACGSCWAFGSTEALNDRMCISHGITYLLSTEDTMSCCTGFACLGSSGCDGGVPDEAWQYFANTGVVTGGDYDEVDTGASCAPYPFPFCSHHESGKYPMCPSAEYTAPGCPTSCPDKKYAGSWSSDKHLAKNSYNYNTVQDAMTGLFQSGSVTVSFDVYEDFLTYKGGVYQPTSSNLLGGHSVKLVGWGTTTDGTPYWLVQNSWNQYWGLNGDFMILRGQDCCGIEDDMVAGDV
jgi:cathepsin B